jgi:signal transduction histidine kinase
MSHEIRTPMTAILGFSDVLLENLEKKENLTAINTIKRNGVFLLELINDILDLSKIEANKLEIESIPCSLIDVVADVVSLMRVRAEAKSLTLETEYIGEIPETILGDPTRMRQILINLVGNAIKFTETGSVRLVTQLMQATNRPPCLRLDVIDTGTGISKEHTSKIFLPFTQADSTTSREFGGTGLGLAITQRLVKMHRRWLQ